MVLLAKAVASLLLALLTLIGGGDRVATSFDAFMWAISSQESGGEKDPYGVVNAYGAVGKYQVLKSNVPKWSKQVLGYSISWQKFRDSPDLQEKIVRGILKSYYDRWGARGAAAAWYAGPGNHDLDMSTSPQPGGPSIKKYVDSVVNKASDYKGQSTTASGSGSTAKEVTRTAEELAEDYGFVDALFDSNKELKKLFDKAVAGQWTEEKFQAELRDTKWWKSHSQKERDYLTQQYGDPATAKQEMSQAYIHVRQLAAQLGIVETPSLLKKMNTWAYNSVAKGWDDAMLRNEIGKFISFGGDKWEGEAGEAQEKLHEYAYSMGITMTGSWYSAAAKNVVRGMAAIQDYESQIRKQAKATYVQWAKQIDGGQSVMDLASPYMQSMATILELPSGSITLSDTTIKKALQGKDPKTGMNTVTPLWQFENDLRNDPRWKKTKNAQDSLMQVAHQVLSDFGVKY